MDQPIWIHRFIDISIYAGFMDEDLGLGFRVHEFGIRVEELGMKV